MDIMIKSRDPGYQKRRELSAEKKIKEKILIKVA
jgi:hypothetical protein